MTSRIANLASNNTLVGYLLKNQARLHEKQIQVASEKISQTYEGVASNSERLVNMENTRGFLNSYTASNKIMDLRLDIAATTIESMQTTISDFRTAVINYGGGERKDETRVKDLQDWAFRALKDMQGYLNTSADGRFLFSGARVSDLPADLGLTDLGALQAKYDGAMVKFPTTRDAYLADYSMSSNLTDVTSWLSFERDNGGIGRITATDNSFDNMKAGTTITVTGTTSNNGTYEIASVDATNNYITVVSEMLTTQANDTGGGAITVTTAAGTVLDTNGDFTDLTFSQATGVITAAGGSGSAFSGLAAGQIITVANATDAGNNQTFTIDSVTATTITIKQKKLTDEGIAAAPTLNVTSAGGEISFVDGGASADTIVGAAGRFAGLTAGMKVVVANASDGGNNTTFNITAVSTDNSTLTISKTQNVVARANDGNAIDFDTVESAGTITATSYFKGDSVSITHRADKDRSFEYDMTAINPAFEKAIRAIFIIAQGDFGTEGGLDQNAAARIEEAKYLLNSSLDATAPIIGGATGTELRGNIQQLEMDLSFNKILLKSTNDKNTKFVAFLEASISDVENVDPLEAITRLLDEARNLEVSYNALARIRKLSLADYL